MHDRLARQRDLDRQPIDVLGDREIRIDYDGESAAVRALIEWRLLNRKWGLIWAFSAFSSASWARISASREDWTRGVAELGVGGAFKDRISEPGSWTIGATVPETTIDGGPSNGSWRSTFGRAR